MGVAYHSEPHQYGTVSSFFMYAYAPTSLSIVLLDLEAYEYTRVPYDWYPQIKLEVFVQNTFDSFILFLSLHLGERSTWTASYSARFRRL